MKPYYEADGITIYNGDCLEVLPELPLVDACLTDPPYNAGKKYGAHNDSMDEGDYLEFLWKCFSLIEPKLPLGGALVWFWQGMRVVRGQANAVLPRGMDLHHLAGWFKREFAGDKFYGNRPAMCWEPIIWAAKEGSPAIFYGGKGGHVNRDMLIGNHVRHDHVPDHPCPKTLSVVGSVLVWVCPPSGTVLDPFCGTGTTLRAAKDLGMRAIGIELEERYCEIAVERLAQMVLQEI